MSAYGPFELAPLEAVIVPERPAPGSAPTIDAVREQAFAEPARRPRLRPCQCC
jgi:hypothetical protein